MKPPPPPPSSEDTASRRLSESERMRMQGNTRYDAARVTGISPRLKHDRLQDAYRLYYKVSNALQRNLTNPVLVFS